MSFFDSPFLTDRGKDQSDGLYANYIAHMMFLTRLSPHLSVVCSCICMCITGGGLGRRLMIYNKDK